MASPWEQDEIVQPATASKRAPWESDPVVSFGGVTANVDTTAQRAPNANNSRFAQLITGPQQSGEAKPSLFRMDSDFRDRSGASIGQMFVGAAKDMFGSREGAAEYLAEKTGGQVGADAEGNPVINLPDGTAYRLNDPGIDSTDVGNVAGNVGAMLTPAGWVARFNQAKNLGVGWRMLTQAGGMGAADAALQATANEGQVDPLRVGASAIGGAGGELLGTGINTALKAAKGVGRAVAGSDKVAAQQMLDEAGVPVTPDRLKRVTGSMGEVRAGADPAALLGREEFGFNYTLGQKLTDQARKFPQLSKEEALRQSPRGGPLLRDAEAQNRDQLKVALGNISSRLGGAPGATPAELVQGSASRLASQADTLKTRIGQAYDEAGKSGRTAISAKAVATMPQRLAQAVRDYAPNTQLTPATAKTLEQLQLGTQTILNSAEGGNVAGVTLKALETQRRILGKNYEAATNASDREAMTVLKNEFDSWMDDAIDTALVSGDPAALRSLKEARALRAEYGRRFEGGKDTDKFIAGLLDGSRTPEELLNIALGAGQVSKTGAARFVERLAKAADNDPDVLNGLRAAHFDKMTKGATGEPLDIGEIVRNIQRSEYSNASAVRAIYSPKEWGDVKRLAMALQPLIAKGDLAKSSGSTERLTRFLSHFQAFRGTPIIGKILDRVKEGMDAGAAYRTINAKVKPGPKPPAPIYGSAATGVAQGNIR